MRASEEQIKNGMSFGEEQQLYFSKYDGFFINNHKWEIEERPEEYLLEEYHKRSPDAYSCMGLTFYKEHKIWIATDLCYDEKIRTLKHELTHCYIWENGFYNVDFNNEEMICDFVASIYSFIESVIRGDSK